MSRPREIARRLVPGGLIVMDDRGIRSGRTAVVDEDFKDMTGFRRSRHPMPPRIRRRIRQG